MNQAPLHEPTIADVISRAVSSILGSVHTSFPGKIDKYDYATGKADIQPLIGRRYNDGSTLDMPIIPSVPVVFPRCSAGSVSFPLTRGDGVLVVCCERSIDEFKSKGGKVVPEDGRRFDLSDAVAIPGFFPFTEKTTISGNNDFQIVFKGQSIFIRENGDIEIGGAPVQNLMTKAYSTALDIQLGLMVTALNALLSAIGITPAVPLWTAPATGLTSKTKAE